MPSAPSLIDRRQRIPKECVPVLQRTFDEMPRPLWAATERQNQVLRRMQEKFRDILKRVLNGDEVRWSELCALLENFNERRSTFYDAEKCRLMDERSATCRESIERIFSGETVTLPSARRIELAPGVTIVYASPEMQQVLDITARLADEDIAVLLLGETGVGKDLIARALHIQSRRENQPFKQINCAALSPHLLESELFGHAKGAFTGAHRDHPGLMTSVGKGTLFLDEIGEMEAHLQAKLLQVLQGGGFRRVGDSNGELKFEGRIVTATNRDLARAIHGGTFRADLFFRIARFPVTVPALRERPMDIDPLIDFFIGKNGSVTITDAARAKLKKHSFPGNVRELEGILERAYILATLQSRDHPVIGEGEIQFILVANGTPQAQSPDAVAELHERLAILENAVERLAERDA